DLPNVAIFAMHDKERLLSFITSKPFNEVRLNIFGLNKTYLKELLVHGAFAFAPSACETVTNAKCGRPISGFGTVDGFDGANSCAGCWIEDKDNIVNADITKYAKLISVAS